MMDLAYIRGLVAHLQRRGVRLGRGLTDAEVERVERRFGWLFPEDLLMLLQYALPTSKGFPDWRSGRSAMVMDAHHIRSSCSEQRPTGPEQFIRRPGSPRPRTPAGALPGRPTAAARPGLSHLAGRCPGGGPG
jgi:hypothetical protein